MNSPGLSRDDRSLGTMAAACAVLVFVVVAASAWLRLAAPPCPPGGCEAFVLADAVRLAHRVAAMGVTVMALVIVALAWKPPARRGRRLGAAAILVLVAALAIVGRSSAGSPPPPVVIANLLGGLVLLAATAGLAAAARVPRAGSSPSFMAATALLVIATVTGAVLAASPPEQPAAIALVHRAAAWASLLAWVLLALRSSLAPQARLAARVCAALLVAQVLLALLATGWPPARWVHNLITSAVIAVAFAGAMACADSARPGLAEGESLPARS